MQFETFLIVSQCNAKLNIVTENINKSFQVYKTTLGFF